MTVKERILAQQAEQEEFEVGAANARPIGEAVAGKPSAAYASRVRRAPVVAGGGGYQIQPATAEQGPIVRPPRIVSLAEAGFLEPSSVVVPSVAICSHGPEKAGKTWTAMTAPGPIACLSTDTGTREVVERVMRETGKKIYLCALTAATALLEAKRGDVGVEEWARAKSALYSAVEDKRIRTLVVDTLTEVFDLCKLAAFGKLSQIRPHHYQVPNSEFRNLLKYCYEYRAGLNLIFLHKQKKIYVASKKTEESNWNGNWERAGMADVPYLTDIVAEHYKRLEIDENQFSHLYFGIKVTDSRLKPELLVGQSFESEAGSDDPGQCNFASIAMTCFPDTDVDYWS